MAACATVAAAGVLASKSPAAPAHFADADNSTLVLAGHALYADRCGSCHGRHLQGQPLWQWVDANSWRRAPAHDYTGHTWQHSDDDLFYITKFGRFAYTPISSPSGMPAFGTRMTDQEIISVLAFIKSRWPAPLRAAQASLNPGGAGTPQDSKALNWKFRALCTPRT
jgi:mono/diheme cytochrome c family protein